MVLRAGEACREVEKSYKVSEKLLALWGRVEMTGKGAENLSTTWANIEKVYKIFLKLTKGA